MTTSQHNNHFHIIPADVPNEGILYVDHQAHARSGHGGNCLTQCRNGDIISFYSNVSGDIMNGHSVAGWSEYRRSTDGGRTWGVPVVLDYSKQAWDGDECYAALVFGVATAPNGTLVAFVCHFATEVWVKQSPPVCLLSHDHGHTWEAPRPLHPTATVDDASLTFDAVAVHDGQVFVVFMGGADNYCPGPYNLYVSSDNGLSFGHRSTLPFDRLNYYVTAGVLDDGALIVYSYPYVGRESPGINEHDIPYVISRDQGRTWSDVRTTRFAKAIRNPQMSRKIGDLYFLHGRSGSHHNESGHFVLYSSRDGVNWDEGIYLRRAQPDRGGDHYSANAVIGDRLLIQASAAYEGRRVNECHWWVVDIEGT